MKDEILHDLASVPREGMSDLMDWLRASDFFTAPASTKHHLCVPGGLAQHSWNVYNTLCNINAEYSLNIPRESKIICGLLHDVCKIGVYFREMKRVRSPEGAWGDKEVWVFKDDNPLGHGEKSAILVGSHIKLTEEEQWAIRWHMGPWDAEGFKDKRSLYGAMDKSKLLKALMLADQTATWMLEG